MGEDDPLIKAMRDGDILLVDELSLAEDSVLERLNSVLEPGRSITLPEKGGAEVEELTAHPNFLILATMNPGGDFEVKNYRQPYNPFTEVWIGSVGKASEMENMQIRECRRAISRFCELGRILAVLPRKRGKFDGTETTLAVRDLIG